MPLSVIVTGPRLAFDSMLSGALLGPTAEGVNTTLIVQVAPGTSGVLSEQLPANAKSEAALPLGAMRLNSRLAVPELRTVIDCAGLAVWTMSGANSKAVWLV